MKKFENIIIASDLDGTYFGSNTTLVPRNVEKVKWFCENGGHFTFATGRLPMFMLRPLGNVSEYINMPAITGNGSCLYDFKENRVIESKYIDFSLIKEVGEFVSQRYAGMNVGIRGSFDGGIVLSNIECSHTLAEYNRLPDFIEKIVLPTEEWDQFNIYKLNVFCDLEEAESIYLELCNRFSAKASLTRAGFCAAEIMQRGTSKASMLKKFVFERFDSSAILFTVGDYDNDIEMHRISDISVCPSNAVDRVKDICKLQLCSNNEGVVGELIDWIEENYDSIKKSDSI